MDSQSSSSLHDRHKLHFTALLFIYIQIGCAMIGSMAPLYNGASLMNLAVSLYALVAIESGSRNLRRTYVALLPCMILLDLTWFLLYFHNIWNFTANEEYGQSFVFSLGLTFSMQILGFSMRVISLFLWIQIYRLGTSVTDETCVEADFDVESKQMDTSVKEVIKTHNPDDDDDDDYDDDVIGGLIYDQAYFCSLFDDAQDKECIDKSEKQIVAGDGRSTPVLKALQQ
ncbi:uncharacterized protein M6B38_303585 [Iris pallida]|uniref:Transmembrane protein n=1 Tax=Iris pallida TaxID=29817 RepID=A0AAX6HLH5_IRIPA|nr:uncharacterized protein M6B38_303585 [Iris pallida]